MTHRAPGAARCRAGLWGLLLCAALSCSGPQRPSVSVTVTGLQPGTIQLTVQLTLGQESLPQQSFTQDLQAPGPQLGFAFPAGARGHLALTVSAGDLSGCVLAQGSGAADLAADVRYDVTVPLQALPVKICGGAQAQVLVQRTGDGIGQVESSPAGIDCGSACGANFAAGVQMSLTALPALQSYFAGWSGPCSGVADCPLKPTAATMVRAQFGQKVCSQAHFCWEDPLPHGAVLRALWGAGPGAVWAVGDGGAILRYDGAFWSVETSGVQSALSAVWGAGPKEVWAAGDQGVILRYDGAQWSKETGAGTAALYGLWGSSDQDLWAVGDAGVILHRTGTATWAKVASGTATPLRGVWGTAGGDVWAVGDGGLVLRLPAGVTTWGPVPSGTGNGLNGVWGSGPGDVRAVGAGGVVVRWNGTAWGLVQPGTGPGALLGIWGSQASSVYAVGSQGIEQWNGMQWSPVAMAPPLALRAVWGSGPSDVWAVGDGGEILHSDGEFTGWTPLSTAPQRQFVSVSGGSLMDVWALDQQGTVMHRTPTGWARVPVATPGGAVMNAVWVTQPGDVWLVGAMGTVMRWTGKAFAQVASPILSGLNAVWGSGPNDVWVVGDGGVAVHFTGGVADPLAGTATLSSLRAVIGSAGPGDPPTAMTAVGDGGLMVRYGNTGFTPVTTGTTKDLYSIWRSGAGDLWVGGNGVILRGNPGGPFVSFSGNPEVSQSAAYTGVWGSDPSDVWVVGTQGVVLHWTGTDFTKVTPVDITPGVAFHGVWGTDARDMWLVGGGPSGTGAIVRYQLP